MNKSNTKKGISLIVLVITIIVMIILATAIILSLQSSGIIDKANEAKEKTNIANAREIVAMAKAEWELMTASEQKGHSDSFAEFAEKKLIDAGYKTGTGEGTFEVTNDGTIYSYPVIPEGFIASKIESEDEVSEGLVIYQIPESERNSVNWSETKLTSFGDVLKVQNQYNQFVWVPVVNINEFTKVDWKQGITGEDFSNYLFEPYSSGYATEVNDYNAMKASVEKYGGFYIGRYETGLENSEAVCKKGMEVYDEVSWGNSIAEVGNANAAYLAMNFISDSDELVSTLCYGVQWDAALKFITDKYPSYTETYENQGHHNDLSRGAIPTGSNETYAKNNIYDMAGNLTEWTMEVYDDSTSE